MLIPQVVIDTGEAESIISIDAVSDHSYEPDDQIRFMNGIGGREASVRRQIHQIEFHSFVMKGIRLDFGRIGEYSGIQRYDRLGHLDSWEVYRGFASSGDLYGK